MHIRVLAFGVLQWSIGRTVTVDVPEGTSVADLLIYLRANPPAGQEIQDLRSIAVGVNAEYVKNTHILHDGDEVALLPPVSGGSATRTAGDLGESIDSPIRIALTRDVIDAHSLVEQAKHPEDGAVVVFDGIVRNHSRGRTALYLEYEGYEAMALKQMRELAEEARGKYSIRQVTLVHRLGRLEIGESSVLIVVASAHRSAAFDACRWIIDTLKRTVPIWKKEFFADGAVWAPGEPFPDSIAIHTAEPDKNA